MKRTHLLLILVISTFFFNQSAVAGKITKERALQVATEFFNRSTGSHKIPQNFMVLKTSEDLPKFATKGNGNLDPYFYIISGNDGKGFVIVAARDVAKPILGYSLNGNADFSNIPDNMEYWLGFLRSQIQWAEENNISPETTKQYWDNIVTASAATKYLETASWNQGAPYNLQCQYIQDCECVTGCVATAVAEVMRYHKWPKSGTGSTKEYTYDFSGTTITIPSRNLSHSYDWTNMPLTYTGDESDTQRNAVATLMADIGAAFGLKYYNGETSGFIFNSSLVENFGYSTSLAYCDRNKYTDTEWIKILKSEIDQNRPLVYSGQDENGTGGHAFVLDGYNADDYFHINWGWGGYKNNYFLISALNVLSYKFNNYQDVLLNFYPAETGESKPDPSRWLNLEAPGLIGEFVSNESSSVVSITTLDISNLSAIKINADIGFMITNAKGEIIKELVTITLSGFPSFRIYSPSGNITINEEYVKPGNRLRIYYKPEGYDNWYPLYREGSAISQEILITPKETYSIGDSGYASLYSKNNLIVPSGVEVFTYSYDEFSGALIPGEAITEGDIIPGNTGYIIKGTTGTYKFEVTDNTPGSYTSDLIGTLTEISKPSGDVYVLGTKSDKTTFYKYSGDNIPAGKVYFVKSKNNE